MTLPDFGPSYDAAESLEMMQLAAAADAFLPFHAPAGMPAYLDPTRPATGSPFDPAKQGEMPSIFYDRWPSNWRAAGDGTWGDWIIESRLGNQALLAGLVDQTTIPTYCLTFRGTMTAFNAVEDFFALPVPPRKGAMEDLLPKAIRDWLPEELQIILKYLNSSKCYVDMDNNVTAEKARIHLGFRIALESLDSALVQATEGLDFLPKITNPLKINYLSGRINTILKSLGPDKNEINLYVTGHSLGAGMAALAATWLATQPFPGYKINVKCYSFAQPKPGNDYFSYATDIMFRKKGFGFYTVLNSLDTVPQVPLTIQTSDNLNYWQGIEGIARAASDWPIIDKFFKFASNINLPYSLNYMHAGTLVILDGQPVVTSPQTPENIYTFPMNGKDEVPFPEYLVNQVKKPGLITVPQSEWNISKPTTSNAPKVNTTFSNLWQHMPYTYEQLLVQALS